MMDKKEQEELIRNRSYDSFCQRLLLLQDANSVLSDLFPSLELNRNTFSLNFTTKRINSSGMSLIDQLRIFEMLENLDFDGVDCFSIYLVGSSERISSNQINSMLKSLTRLQSLAHLSVQLEKYNPELLFLFMSFEIPYSINRYSFLLKSKFRTISIQQNQGKNNVLKVDFKYESSVKNILEIEKNALNFPSLYEIAHLHRTQPSKEEFLPFSSTQKKLIKLTLDVRYLGLYEQILNILTLLKIWDFDYPRIKFVQFLIRYTSDDYIYKKTEDQIINIQELQKINLFKKVRFSYPFWKEHQSDAFLKLVSFAGGVNVKFQSPFNVTFISEFISDFTNKELCVNLKVLTVLEIEPVYLLKFLELTDMFPNLKHLQLGTKKIVTTELCLFKNFDRIFGLIRRLKYLKLFNSIFLENSILSCQIFTNWSNWIPFYQCLSLALHSLEKPIRLVLDLWFYSLKTERNQVIQAFSSMIDSSNVFDLSCRSFGRFQEIENISNERNSLIYSILVYDSVLKNIMEYNPFVILSDLFDFN